MAILGCKHFYCQTFCVFTQFLFKMYKMFKTDSVLSVDKAVGIKREPNANWKIW